MANNLQTSSANFSSGTADYLNNFYKPGYTVSADKDAAVVAFFETMTNNRESAEILASSVIYTSLAQGVDPMTIVDQLRNMDSEERLRFTSMYLNFNRVGTSQLGIHLPSKNNKYIERLIKPPVISYADGTSPDRAARNARAIKQVNPTATSGYYWVRGYNDVPVQIYCDMNGSEVGSTVGGWMKFDNVFFVRYRGLGVEEFVKNYAYTSSGGFTVDNPRNGILKGVRWDLGDSINFTGIRIRRVQFNNVGGQDGYYAADAPTPQWGSGNPTDEMVTNFINVDYDLGNNFSSYGWAIGNGFAGSTNLIRLYKQASVGEWAPQFAGTITLSQSAFFQYDETALTTGRYLYYYESDSASEYNNLIDYAIWLR